MRKRRSTFYRWHRRDSRVWIHKSKQRRKFVEELKKVVEKIREGDSNYREGCKGGYEVAKVDSSKTK